MIEENTDDSMTKVVSSDSKEPNDELAAEIVNALLGSQLIKESRANSVLDKIRYGKATQSDWRIWAEDLCLKANKDSKQCE